MECLRECLGECLSEWVRPIAENSQIIGKYRKANSSLVRLIVFFQFYSRDQKTFQAFFSESFASAGVIVPAIFCRCPGACCDGHDSAFLRWCVVERSSCASGRDSDSLSSWAWCPVSSRAGAGAGAGAGVHAQVPSCRCHRAGVVWYGVVPSCRFRCHLHGKRAFQADVSNKRLFQCSCEQCSCEYCSGEQGGGSRARVATQIAIE